MTVLLEMVWPFPPLGKERPRGRVFWPQGKSRPPSVNIYTPTRTDHEERDMLNTARFLTRYRDLCTMARLHVCAVKARPKARPALVPREVWATGRRCPRPVDPDGDNVIKLVADALSRKKEPPSQRILRHDGLIVEWYQLDQYAARGESPCVEIELLQWES